MQFVIDLVLKNSSDCKTIYLSYHFNDIYMGKTYKNSNSPPPLLSVYAEKSLFEYFLVKFEFLHYNLSPNQ